MGATNNSTGGSGLRFYRPKNGKLERYNQDTGEGESFRSIYGTFRDCRLKWDEGNTTHKIAAGWKVSVSLEDEDDGGTEVIEAKLDSTFGRMLAFRLSHVSVGDKVQVSGSPGDDPKITFAFVQPIGDDGKPGKYPKPEYPDGAAARLAEAERIVRTHPGFFDAEEAKRQSEAGETAPAETKKKAPKKKADDEYDPFADE